MKGYKGMSANMQCRGMQYEVGKSYHVDGEIEVCKNGLHFCENLRNVFCFYTRNGGNRFFEVEASGIIKTYGKKSAASDLMILRELSDIEINRNVYGNIDVYGDGDGHGNGDGNGYGNGSGNGYGNGIGNSHINSNDYGDGYGYCNGFGYGYGDGDGNGPGDGYDIIQKVLMFA